MGPASKSNKPSVEDELRAGAQAIVDNHDLLGYDFEVLKDGDKVVGYGTTFKHTPERKISLDELGHYIDILEKSVVQNDPVDQSLLEAALVAVPTQRAKIEP